MKGGHCPLPPYAQVATTIITLGTWYLETGKIDILPLCRVRCYQPTCQKIRCPGEKVGATFTFHYPYGLCAPQLERAHPSALPRGSHHHRKCPPPPFERLGIWVRSRWKAQPEMVPRRVQYLLRVEAEGSGSCKSAAPGCGHQHLRKTT